MFKPSKYIQDYKSPYQDSLYYAAERWSNFDQINEKHIKNELINDRIEIMTDEDLSELLYYALKCPLFKNNMVTLIKVLAKIENPATVFSERFMANNYFAQKHLINMIDEELEEAYNELHPLSADEQAQELGFASYSTSI